MVAKMFWQILYGNGSVFCTHHHLVNLLVLPSHINFCNSALLLRYLYSHVIIFTIIQISIESKSWLMMPAQTTKLPSIPGLTERPPSIKSGKSLKGRVKICYRSDLYMQEQQKHVIGFQEQLKQALNDLKTAKFGSLEFHTNRVQHLKAKSDEMIIVLQVSNNLFWSWLGVDLLLGYSSFISTIYKINI